MWRSRESSSASWTYSKDEQDREPLEAPLLPVYIQEKIKPQAIIEDLVDFYHHEQNWSNRMILGDSLQVMASLAEKEGLKGKV